MLQVHLLTKEVKTAFDLMHKHEFIFIKTTQQTSPIHSTNLYHTQPYCIYKNVYIKIITSEAGQQLQRNSFRGAKP